jgi:hypothetical protein
MALTRPVSGQSKKTEVCFELAEAQRLTLDAETLPLVQAQLEHQRALTVVRESQVRSLESANASVSEAAAKATKAIQEDRESRPDPLKWFVVGGAAGVLVGTILTVAIVEAFR